LHLETFLNNAFLFQNVQNLFKPGAQPTEGKGRDRIGREGKEIAQCKQIQQYTTHGSLRKDLVVYGYI
jgi:hypothetical protein